MPKTTETLEPIVIQEPKELPVRSFNKEEIEEIARGVVAGENVADVNILKGTYIGDETAFIEGKAKVGDIVVDVAGFVGAIKEIAFTSGALTKVVISGVEDNNTPTTYTFESDEWSHTEFSAGGGTKLYKHSIAFEYADETYYLDIISTYANAFTDVFDFDRGFITGRLQDSGGDITGNIETSCLMLPFNGDSGFITLIADQGTNVRVTFILPDEFTDTVTEL